jgi:glycosidase
MWSPDDPSNRMPMVWKELEPYDDAAVRFDPELFAHYQRLAAIRHKLPALRLGMYRTVLADDRTGVLAFARELGDQHVYVVINRSGAERTVKVPVGGTKNGANWVDWLNTSHMALTDPPTSADDGRPTLKPRPGTRRLTPKDGAIELRLPAYGSAIFGAEP